MKTAIATIKGISPYSQSAVVKSARNQRETGEDYEKRTWRERIHADAKGTVVIPPMAFKNCIAEAAKFMSLQVPGKGKATYTKHFEAGVLVIDASPLEVKKDDVEGEWLFLPSDGKRGGGKRVWKCYPKIENWQATVTFYILDEAITEDVFAKHLEEAGKFIGIGRFRPRNNGFYGRFTVEKIQWLEEGVLQAAE